MTDQPMDYRDYLIRQQQQDHIRQRFDALFTKDEEHAAAATQSIENLAYHTAQEAAAAYDYVQESLTDVITQTRDLRARIPNGTVSDQWKRPTSRPATAKWAGTNNRPTTKSQSFPPGPGRNRSLARSGS